jgi:hypothetical protein
MKFSILGMLNGKQIPCSNFSMNYCMGDWEVNISLEADTLSQETGLCSVMVLAPHQRDRGKVQTVFLKYQTWKDVHEVLEKCRVGDRSVFDRIDPMSIPETYGKFSHQRFSEVELH